MEKPSLVAAIRERYERAQATIAAAAQAAGRQPDAVRLVVVTKSQPLSAVQAAIDAGARLLGENYAEEAVGKMQACRSDKDPHSQEIDTKSARATSMGVEWHMIGHVQGRKAQLVARHFDLVHSVDSVRLAQRLDRFARELDRELAVLLEFNVGGEGTKQGWAAHHLTEWPELVQDVETISELHNLRIHGLMTMPPLTGDLKIPAGTSTGCSCRDSWLPGWPALTGELSMGTSADYAVAVEEGATLVRVGEAILGPRSAQEAA
jgi:pyridoxal phosphate enzyme (YggS family)